jgi:serine/threonine protein kinase
MIEIHARGIAHCDLKESNILITFNKENQISPLNANLPLQLVISDFGISKSIPDILNKKVGVGSGTPKYMAPE